MENKNVEPAEGKLGIMVVGFGAVTSTFMTGVLMARKGLAKPVGSMTQYDKIRVGKGADKQYKKYGDIVTLEMKDQYYNMREMVEPHYHVIDKAVRAMEMAGVKPHIQPIRGGTDGANLSFKGLPCPNIFAGGLNFHGKFEWVPLESMQKASAVILHIVHLFAE